MTFNIRSFAAAIAVTCSVLLAGAAIDASQGAPAASFASTEEEFKYGSVGIESEEGMPYWIWQALPRVFADKLPRPGGYDAFGFVWEPGRELPIGFSTAELFGGRRIAINCAFCHTGVYRLEPAGRRRIVAAGPGNLVNPQAYIRFLQTVAEDPRFNANELLGAIDGMTRLSWMQRMQYRWLLIPATRRALQRQKEQYAWTERNPDWGPGRIDPFNPVKFGILRQPIDKTIGNSDMVPLWNMKARRAMPLHWDGLTTSLHESVLSSAIGDGASRKSLALANLGRIEQWLLDLPSPRYPFAIDAALAARGEAVYTRDCATCHAPGGKRAGAVIPIGEIGTDEHRLNMWTAGAAAAYNEFANGYQWDFSEFRKTDGYVAVPLDGIWLRAPYLHNGSVPSLEELLDAPGRRRRVFYRGYDLYDPVRAGFVSDGPIAERIGMRYDTAQPGNGNGGHVYGTTLPVSDRLALLEFLKTL